MTEQLRQELKESFVATGYSAEMAEQIVKKMLGEE